METFERNTWHEANQQYLMAALAVVRWYISRFSEQQSNNDKSAPSDLSVPEDLQEALQQTAAAMPAPAALDTLTSTFNLSSFERNILLMCAGVELDSTFATNLASIKDNELRGYPTFSLALATLPVAHWSALMSNAPLRYWRLIEVKGNGVLTTSHLHIDERILHYLAGAQHMDERIAEIVAPFADQEELAPSHRLIADHMIQAWSQTGDKSQLPVVIQLCGADPLDRRLIAANASNCVGLILYIVSSHAIPSSIMEMNQLIRLWEREAALSGSVLLLECDETDTQDGSRLQLTARFCESLNGPMIISFSKKGSLTLRQPMISLEVKKPTRKEQQKLWENYLGTEVVKLNGELKAIVSQFDLSAQSIRSVISETMGSFEKSDLKNNKPHRVGTALWNTCRIHTRPGLDDLAQRIEPLATWDELILPDQQKQTLKEIAMHVRHRNRVYEDLGFAGKCSRGLGITTLFTGESGTGKTMASEVLARELQLDLYRIDLSQVVNKYIGETEKNLKRVFDAAEDGGAILLFDEADALFGKRSEVKDSHDRYANIEVSYLLQRMEAYHGLAILTTNMRKALDSAFLRRIRFIVQFPFPDHKRRAAIWKGIFPDETPVKDLDMEKLARLNIAGGNIRNIALNSTFLATDDNEPVDMGHLLRAARSEYAKLEKPLSAVEIGGWE